MKKNPKEILNLVGQAIFDKKGFNIVALDVGGISSITDYVIVAEGNVDRHVMAISKGIQETLCEVQEKPTFVEGGRAGEWIVLDYTQLVIHIFMPGLRERYNIEQLFPNADLLELDIDVSNLESKAI